MDCFEGGVGVEGDSFWRSLRAEGEIFLGADDGAASVADDVDGAGVSVDMAAAKKVVFVAGNVLVINIVGEHLKSGWWRMKSPGPRRYGFAKSMGCCHVKYQSHQIAHIDTQQTTKFLAYAAL